MKRTLSIVEETLGSYPSLRGLSVELLALDLEREVQTVNATPNATLFETGRDCPGFPLVLQGEIRVERQSRSGRSMELYRVHTGEVCVFSVSGLLSQAQMAATGTANVPTRLLLLPPRVFERWTAHLPFRQFVFAIFAERLADLMSVVDALAFKSLSQRLAGYLLGQGRYVRMTHQTIAGELGTVREIVTRLLNRFESAGLVKLSRECIEIIDPVRLRTESSVERP